MGGECGMSGGEKRSIEFWWGNQQEGNHPKDLGVHGRIILKWI